MALSRTQTSEFSNNGQSGPETIQIAYREGYENGLMGSRNNPYHEFKQPLLWGAYNYGYAVGSVKRLRENESDLDK